MREQHYAFNFVVLSWSSLDQILLKGHFKLTKSILTNCTTHGEQLIDLLFKSFLFQPFFNGSSCDTLQDETMTLGYELLIELGRDSKKKF